MGAIGTLVMGVTFGFFSSQVPPQSGTFSAGTITLSSGASTSCTYGAAAIEPGDSLAPCVLEADYSGSLPAWVALDIKVTTSSGSGGDYLYNPAGDASAGGGPGLTFSVSDGHGDGYSAPAGSGGSYLTPNELAATDASGATVFNSGDKVTFTLSPSFLSSNGNNYQGGSVTFTITAHAVQTRNNGSISGCSIGSECDSTSPGAGAPAWS